eukprot:UN29392
MGQNEDEEIFDEDEVRKGELVLHNLIAEGIRENLMELFTDNWFHEMQAKCAETVNNRMNKLEKKIDDLSSKLKESELVGEKLSNEVKKSQKTILALGQSVTELDHEKGELEKTVSKLKDKISDFDDMKSLLKELKTKIKKLEESDKKRSKNQQKKSRIPQLEKDPSPKQTENLADETLTQMSDNVEDDDVQFVGQGKSQVEKNDADKKRREMKLKLTQQINGIGDDSSLKSKRPKRKLPASITSGRKRRRVSDSEDDEQPQFAAFPVVNVPIPLELELLRSNCQILSTDQKLDIRDEEGDWFAVRVSKDNRLIKQGYWFAGPKTNEERREKIHHIIGIIHR